MAKTIYEIMHKDRLAAKISDIGECRIYYSSFMPYNLYLEESNAIEDMINNVTNFYYWCAARLLTLDRQYAKVSE